MPTVPTKSGAALLLESRIGEQFDALVTGASDKGTWVRLLKIPVASPKSIVHFKGAEVQRIGEAIKITFDSGILFDIDKSELRPVSQTNLAELAKILNKYPDTNILIEGHTDDTGSDDHNIALSKDRAQSVSHYLATVEVKPARFSIAGYGEAQPIVTNDTPEGRQKNRRVDIAVLANDKLKKAAQEKAKG